jgi:putative flavoprotein involved in K+ transport
MSRMRSPCVVIGAGAAGLAVSRALADAGVEHLVLERHGVADTWRKQRWDSFRLNTPGWMNQVLGAVESTSFSYRDEVVHLLTTQAAALPVRVETPVLGLDHDGSDFVVQTADDRILASTVVLACGLRNLAKTPPAQSQIGPRPAQIHSSEYRNEAQLPAGAVLVVGGAQSGCQISEDLAVAGRRVYLSTSRVGHYPWVYRGRELVGWLADCGFWDQRPQDLTNPSDISSPFPVVASGGRNLNLRILANHGVTLLGRFEGADGERVTFSGSPADNIRYADQVAARMQGLADDYIARNAIDAPDPEGEPELDAEPLEATPATGLDLAEHDITTIIWATGFTGDLSWVHVPVHDNRGVVVHDGCASPFPGLWYVGFPWLTRRRSGIFYGVSSDADDVREGVLGHLAAGR